MALEAASAWLAGPEGGCKGDLGGLLSSSEATCPFVSPRGSGPVGTAPPAGPSDDLAFALKLPNGSGHPLLQLGRLGSQPLADILQLLSRIYLPALLAEPGWPEQLKHDFLGNLHCFLAVLTDCTHAQQGRTVLYVPAEGIAEAAGAVGPGRVQLLESLLLQWTRQIRALVDRSTENDLHGAGGPLAELEFWRDRTANLESIRVQLHDPQVVASLQALEAAKSPSLPTFMGLARDIEREAQRAHSNAQFLAVLEQPCLRLATATPREVPALLPDILDAARLVWTLPSPDYHTPELLASLLRRVSAAVIERCHSTLSGADIFAGGDVHGALARLQQCVATAASWRELYAQAAQRASASLPERPWDFAPATIFAHLDAFAQRCLNLQDVCAAQKQFACHLDVDRVVAGPRAAEVGRALEEVRAGFAQQMERLQGLRYDVLDVRTIAWYEDFAAFKAAARDLDVMLGNILAVSFDEAATLASQLDALCIFAAAATRDGLRRTIEVKMGEWHQRFMEELNAVKGMFEVVKMELPAGLALPSQAGRAVLLRGLLRRIERTWDGLQSMASCLPAVPLAAGSAAAYEAVHSGLQQFINTTTSQWFAGVDRDLKDHLGNSLLQQDKAGGGLLAANLSVDVVQAMEQGSMFERLRLGVPGAVSDLLAQRHQLHALHTCLVQYVVRPYNSILESLSKDERRLFQDRLRYLDRRVLPGVNKLTWLSPKHQTDFYCKDAAALCKETAAAVASLKQANAAVVETCTLLRDTLLIAIEKKRVYTLAEFGEKQEAHQAAMRTMLAEAYIRLQDRLVAEYSCFAGDSNDVQHEWLAHLQHMDAQILEAITVMVRRSLHEMARALQRERKASEVPPLFVLSLVLDTNTGRVELNPTFQNLFDLVMSVSKVAVALVDCLPRLPGAVLEGCSRRGHLAASLRQLPAEAPYVEKAGKSEEEIAKQMQGGISSIVEKVQALLLYFEKKYRSIWENEKDAYLRRYERANKPAATFLADIDRFRELSDQVLGEDSSATMRFLRLDCSTLKQTLVASCELWATRFTALLTTLARQQLTALEEALVEPTKALAEQEATGSAGWAQLEEVHARLAGDVDELEGKVRQCQERYTALESLEVPLLSEEVGALHQLPAKWTAFLHAMKALAAQLAELPAPDQLDMQDQTRLCLTGPWPGGGQGVEPEA